MAFREFADTTRMHRALLTNGVVNVEDGIRRDRLESCRIQPTATQPLRLTFNSVGGESKQQQQAHVVFSTPTLKERQEASRELNDGYYLKFSTTSAIVLGSAICLWLLLFVLVGAFYFNLSSTMTAYKMELRPHLQEAVQHMSNVLEHVDHAATSADHMLAEAGDLEHSVVPAIAHAVNDSAAVLHKLESIAQNPVLKLSLAS